MMKGGNHREKIIELYLVSLDSEYILHQNKLFFFKRIDNSQLILGTNAQGRAYFTGDPQVLLGPEVMVLHLLIVPHGGCVIKA